MSQKYASFSAEDTRDSSTLPSDFDAVLVTAVFSREMPDNYNPGEGNDPIFSWFTLLIDDAGEYAGKSEEERTMRQPYSVGGSAGKEFDISDDGFGLIPKDETVTATRKGSKFDLVKCSLENEGVSKTVTRAGDLSKLAGLKAHWRRVDDEKLLGKKREFNDADGKKKKFPPQTLVAVKILALPGEKAAPVTKTTAASAPAPSASAPAGAVVVEGDLDTQTSAYLKSVLAGAKDNKVQRSQLVALLSKAAIKASNRQDIARRGSDEEFLKKLAEEGSVIGEDFFQITYDPTAKPQMVGMVPQA